MKDNIASWVRRFREQVRMAPAELRQSLCVLENEGTDRVARHIRLVANITDADRAPSISRVASPDLLRQGL